MSLAKLLELRAILEPLLTQLRPLLGAERLLDEMIHEMTTTAAVSHVISSKSNITEDIQTMQSNQRKERMESQEEDFLTPPVKSMPIEAAVPPKKRPMAYEGNTAPKRKRVTSLPRAPHQPDPCKNTAKKTNEFSRQYNCDLEGVVQRKDVINRFAEAISQRVDGKPQFFSAKVPLVKDKPEFEYMELIASYNQSSDPIQKLLRNGYEKDDCNCIRSMLSKFKLPNFNFILMIVDKLFKQSDVDVALHNVMTQASNVLSRRQVPKEDA